MIYELLYTSAPRGLGAGSAGYCTVASTAGLPADLADRLEKLSVYAHRAVGPDPARSGNPLVLAHRVMTLGYRPWHVLSRVADAGLDYSDRGNFLAHHLAATEPLPAAGPAWLLGRGGAMLARWDGTPRALAPRDRLPDADAPPAPCRLWERAAGDAGWAGVLAAATDPNRPAVLLHRPDDDPLALFAEALALLTPAERWRVTFTTADAGEPAAVQWRAVATDSPAAAAAARRTDALVIRLDGRLKSPPGGPLTDAARTGEAVRPRAEPVPDATRSPAAGLPRPAAARPERRIEAGRAEVPRPPAAPPAAGWGRAAAVGVLSAGVAGALLCAAEAATGRSPLRHAGVVGADERAYASAAAKQEAAAKLAEDLLRDEKANVVAARRAGEDEIKALTASRNQAEAEKKTLAKDAADERARAAAEKKALTKGVADARTQAATLTTDLQNAANERRKAEGDLARMLSGKIVTAKLKGKPGELGFPLLGEGPHKLELFGSPFKAKPGAEAGTIEVSSAKQGWTFRVDDGQVKVSGGSADQLAKLGPAVLRVTGNGGREQGLYQFFDVEPLPVKLGDNSLKAPAADAALAAQHEGRIERTGLLTDVGEDDLVFLGPIELHVGNKNCTLGPPAASTPSPKLSHPDATGDIKSAVLEIKKGKAREEGWVVSLKVSYKTPPPAEKPRFIAEVGRVLPGLMTADGKPVTQKLFRLESGK